MREVLFFMLSMFLIIGISLAGPEFKIIEDFKKLTNWIQSPEIKVASGKYGFEPSKDEKGARMWYLGTSGFRDAYYWYWYKINCDVSEYDYVVIKYKLGKGTKFTVDIWFDNKQLVPRAANYITGTGEWQELKIPVRGQILTDIGLSISEDASDLGEDRVYEAFFKEIRVEKERQVMKKEEEESALPEVIIIPTPKKMKILDEKLVLTSSGKVLFSILLSKNPTETEKIAAQDLVDEISKLSGIREKAVILTEKEKLPETKIIFALGINLSLFNKFNINPPDKKEGYIIKLVKDGDKNVVILCGKDKTGVYWAVQTLLQLLQKEKEEVILPICEILDWPTYLYRSLATGRDLQANIKSVRYKINVLFHPWWDEGIYGKWDKPDEKYIKKLQEEVDFAVKRGINIAQQVCPYYGYGMREKSGIRCSKQEDIDKLFNTYKLSLEKGNRVVTLSFDDPSREYFHPEDIEFFKGDVLKGHAYLLAELSKRIKKEYPDTIITVTTRDYEGSTGVKDYYDNEGVPKDVIIMWTGHSGVTLSFMEDEIKKYKEEIGGRRFILFDNTPGQMYGMGRNIRMCDLYADGYNGLYKYCYGVHGMHRFLNPPYPELNDILSLTMAEYMWNPENYNAEKTLRRVLAKVAGNKAVEHLLKFKYYYLRIANKYPVEKDATKLTTEEKERYRITEERYKNVKVDMEEARKALEEIKRVCINEELTKELELIYKKMVGVIEILRITQAKIYAPQGEIVFYPNDFLGGSGYKVYSYLCEPKEAVWIYGKKTTTHTIESEFELTESPKNDAILEIEGQDDDKEGKTQIEILINDNTIFKGPNEFKECGWSKISYLIKKSFMRVGRNILTIRNLEDSDSYNSKWFMLSRAKIIF